MVDVVDTLAIPENLSENEGARPGSPIMRPVEFVAAALVAFIICVLLLGVTSRYVFSLPFVWVDEVASIAFIWLAMLGAAIAVDRNEHLRLTLFVGMMSARLREFVETLALLAVAAFLGAMVDPAIEYAVEESYVTSAALNIPVQGTAAEGFKKAMIALHAALAGLGGRGVLCVHDEYIAEVPEARADEARELVQRTMQEAMAEVVPSVPIVVDTRTARSWAEK